MTQYDDFAVKAIERMGGTSAVARLCEIAPASVSEWKRTGIPSARLQYLRLARPDAFRGIDPGQHVDAAEAAA